MNEEANLPRPDRDRPLDEVIEDFARRVCPGGPYGDIDEWSVYDESFRRLVAWAGETGRFFEGLQPLKEGGREHDLSHDPLTGTWLKFTKPSVAGYANSLAFIRYDVAVFDLRPANVVRTAEGIIVPIRLASAPPMRADKSADRAEFTSLPASSQSRACHNRRDFI